MQAGAADIPVLGAEHGPEDAEAQGKVRPATWPRRTAVKELVGVFSAYFLEPLGNLIKRFIPGNPLPLRVFKETFFRISPPHRVVEAVGVVKRLYHGFAFGAETSPRAEVIIRLPLNFHDDPVDPVGANSALAVATPTGCLNPRIVPYFRVTFYRHPPYQRNHSMYPPPLRNRLYSIAS